MWIYALSIQKEKFAATFPDGQNIGPEAAFVESPADSQVVQGCQFFKVFDEHQLEYILLANGDSDDVLYDRKDCKFSDAESFSSI